jgi:hypothetical protein
MAEDKDVNNEVQKSLEKFDKELDKYLAIKQKIETAFSVQNEKTRNEERALQIKLAQLQTDVQNYLAICLALFAAMAALIAVFATNPLSYQGIILFVTILLFGYYAFKAVKRAQAYRNQMNNP